MHIVEITVADAGLQNLNLYLIITDGMAVEFVWMKYTAFIKCGCVGMLSV